MSWQPGHDPTVDLRDDATLEQAVTARTDERLLHRVSVETATLTGTLRDLAERRAGLTVSLPGDHDLQGTLLAVALDHVVIATGMHRRAHVRRDAIRSVRPDPRVRVPVAQGHRPARTDRTLLHLLSRWEEDRPRLGLVLRDHAEPLHARLVAVGEDVVTLDPGDGRPTYVPADAIDVVMADHR